MDEDGDLSSEFVPSDDEFNELEPFGLGSDGAFGSDGDNQDDSWAAALGVGGAAKKRTDDADGFLTQLLTSATAAPGADLPNDPDQSFSPVVTHAPGRREAAASAFDALFEKLEAAPADAPPVGQLATPQATALAPLPDPPQAEAESDAASTDSVRDLISQWSSGASAVLSALVGGMDELNRSTDDSDVVETPDTVADAKRQCVAAAGAAVNRLTEDTASSLLVAPAVGCEPLYEAMLKQIASVIGVRSEVLLRLQARRKESEPLEPSIAIEAADAACDTVPSLAAQAMEMVGRAVAVSSHPVQLHDSGQTNVTARRGPRSARRATLVPADFVPAPEGEHSDDGSHSPPVDSDGTSETSDDFDAAVVIISRAALLPAAAECAFAGLPTATFHAMRLLLKLSPPDAVAQLCPSIMANIAVFPPHLVETAALAVAEHVAAAPLLVPRLSPASTLPPKWSAVVVQFLADVVTNGTAALDDVEVNMNVVMSRANTDERAIAASASVTVLTERLDKLLASVDLALDIVASLIDSAALGGVDVVLGTRHAPQAASGASPIAPALEPAHAVPLPMAEILPDEDETTTYGGLDVLLGVVHFVHRHQVVCAENTSEAVVLTQRASSSGVDTAMRVTKLTNPLTLYKAAPPREALPDIAIAPSTLSASDDPSSPDRLAAAIAKLSSSLAGDGIEHANDDSDAASDSGNDQPQQPLQSGPLDRVAEYLTPADAAVLLRLVGDVVRLFADVPCGTIACDFGAAATVAVHVCAEERLTAAASPMFSAALSALRVALFGFHRVRHVIEEACGVVFVVSRLPNRSAYEIAITSSGLLPALANVFHGIATVVLPWVSAYRADLEEQRAASDEMTNSTSRKSAPAAVAAGAVPRAALLGQEKWEAWRGTMSLLGHQQHALSRILLAFRGFLAGFEGAKELSLASVRAAIGKRTAQSDFESYAAIGRTGSIFGSVSMRRGSLSQMLASRGSLNNTAGGTANFASPGTTMSGQTRTTDRSTTTSDAVQSVPECVRVLLHLTDGWSMLASDDAEEATHHRSQSMRGMNRSMSMRGASTSASSPPPIQEASMHTGNGGCIDAFLAMATFAAASTVPIAAGERRPRGKPGPTTAAIYDPESAAAHFGWLSRALAFLTQDAAMRKNIVAVDGLEAVACVLHVSSLASLAPNVEFEDTCADPAAEAELCTDLVTSQALRNAAVTAEATARLTAPLSPHLDAFAVAAKSSHVRDALARSLGTVALDAVAPHLAHGLAAVVAAALRAGVSFTDTASTLHHAPPDRTIVAAVRVSPAAAPLCALPDTGRPLRRVDSAKRVKAGNPLLPLVRPELGMIGRDDARRYFGIVTSLAKTYLSSTNPLLQEALIAAEHGTAVAGSSVFAQRCSGLLAVLSHSLHSVHRNERGSATSLRLCAIMCLREFVLHVGEVLTAANVPSFINDVSKPSGDGGRSTLRQASPQQPPQAPVCYTAFQDGPSSNATESEGSPPQSPRPPRSRTPAGRSRRSHGSPSASPQHASPLSVADSSSVFTIDDEEHYWDHKRRLELSGNAATDANVSESEPPGSNQQDAQVENNDGAAIAQAQRQSSDALARPGDEPESDGPDRSGAEETHDDARQSTSGGDEGSDSDEAAGASEEQHHVTFAASPNTNAPPSAPPVTQAGRAAGDASDSASPLRRRSSAHRPQRKLQETAIPGSCQPAVSLVEQLPAFSPTSEHAVSSRSHSAYCSLALDSNAVEAAVATLCYVVGTLRVGHPSEERSQSPADSPKRRSEAGESAAASRSLRGATKTIIFASRVAQTSQEASSAAPASCALALQTAAAVLRLPTVVVTAQSHAVGHASVRRNSARSVVGLHLLAVRSEVLRDVCVNSYAALDAALRCATASLRDLVRHHNTESPRGSRSEGHDDVSAPGGRRLGSFMRGRNSTSTIVSAKDSPYSPTLRAACSMHVASGVLIALLLRQPRSAQLDHSDTGDAGVHDDVASSVADNSAAMSALRCAAMLVTNTPGHKTSSTDGTLGALKPLVEATVSTLVDHKDRKLCAVQYKALLTVRVERQQFEAEIRKLESRQHATEVDDTDADAASAASPRSASVNGAAQRDVMPTESIEQVTAALAGTFRAMLQAQNVHFVQSEEASGRAMIAREQIDALALLEHRIEVAWAAMKDRLSHLHRTERDHLTVVAVATCRGEEAVAAAQLTELAERHRIVCREDAQRQQTALTFFAQRLQLHDAALSASARRIAAAQKQLDDFQVAEATERRAIAASEQEERATASEQCQNAPASLRTSASASPLYDAMAASSTQADVQQLVAMLRETQAIIMELRERGAVSASPQPPTSPQQACAAPDIAAPDSVVDNANGVDRRCPTPQDASSQPADDDVAAPPNDVAVEQIAADRVNTADETAVTEADRCGETASVTAAQAPQPSMPSPAPPPSTPPPRVVTYRWDAAHLGLSGTLSSSSPRFSPSRPASAMMARSGRSSIASRHHGRFDDDADDALAAYGRPDALGVGRDPTPPLPTHIELFRGTVQGSRPASRMSPPGSASTPSQRASPTSSLSRGAAQLSHTARAQTASSANRRARPASATLRGGQGSSTAAGTSPVPRPPTAARAPSATLRARMEANGTRFRQALAWVDTLAPTDAHSGDEGALSETVLIGTWRTETSLPVALAAEDGYARPCIADLCAALRHAATVGEGSSDQASMLAGDVAHVVSSNPQSHDASAPPLLDIDLGLHYVGDAAVFEGLGDALRQLRGRLRSVALPRNGLSSRSMATLLLDCLGGAPHLAQLDLRGNKGITASAGRTLLRFVRTTPALRTLLLDGTQVFAATRTLIDAELSTRAP